MHKFLPGDAILPAIRAALRSAASCDLAVAYWGKGAVETIGLSEFQGAVRVLCDAWSGACNPEQLEQLRSKYQLRTLDGLHAKVYLTESAAIVGSANASTNGLGEEGVQAGNTEAAALIEDKHCLQEIDKWFEEIWQKAVELTSGDIKSIRPLWKEHQKHRKTRVRGVSTVFDMFNADPHWFENKGIRIVAYEGGDLSNESKEDYRSVAHNLYGPKRVKKYDDNDTYPVYEDTYNNWDIAEGEYVIDFTYMTQSGRLTFGGIWKVKKNGIRKLRRSTNILLDECDDLLGLEFPSWQQRALGRYVMSHIKAHRFETDPAGNMLDMPLYDFWREVVSKGDPWLMRMSDQAKQRILAFAGAQSRRIIRIWVGKVGTGVRPNFRFAYDDGSHIDYDGKTYDKATGSFSPFKPGIKNTENIVELPLT